MGRWSSSLRFVALVGVAVCAVVGAGAPVGAAPTARFDQRNLPAGWRWPPSPAMRSRGQACLRALRARGVDYEVASPTGLITTPVTVPEGRFGPLWVRPYIHERSQVMDCHMALTLSELAPELREAGVRALLVSRYYHARRARLRGKSVGLLSRHALGLALDIRGITGRRGRTHWIERGVRNDFLQGLAATLSGSEALRAVLTPYNDVRHRHHFHLSALMTIDERSPDQRIDARGLRALVATSGGGGH